MRGRVARCAALVLTTMTTTVAIGLAGAGTASAQTAPAGNAAFVRGGVQVYPENAVGVACWTLGLCDGVADRLADSAVPRYLSRRPGEAVLVTCRSDDVARVVGFFGPGDDLVTGWSNAGGLQLRAGESVPSCGVLH